tara:strand:+ start:42449 stop:43033 length:585 start_codon:yes stop_codon:yes gene_type:complete
MKNSIYDFVFKGLLTENALDKTDRIPKQAYSAFVEMSTVDKLPFELLDDSFSSAGKKMAAVYVALFSFENSVRKFVSDLLLEKVGENWWVTCVQQNMKQKAESRLEEEKKILWHAPRGDEPINFLDFGDLAKIMTSNENWARFEPYIRDQEWAKNLLTSLERSRNVIMHSGSLGERDIERIGTLMEDWLQQIGS